MILYANSDSYGVEANGGQVYSYFLGKLLGCDRVVNNGLSGSCNNRILRTTLRDLMQLREENKDEEITAVICLGSMIRHEWWDISQSPVDNDGHFRSFQIHGVMNDKSLPYYKYAMEWYRVWDDEAQQTDLFRNLVMLTAWLKLNKIKYIMFAGSEFTYKKISYNDVFIKHFAQAIFNDPGIMDLNEYSFVKTCLDAGFVPYDYQKWQNFGHHAELAHEYFATFLKEKIDQLL